jgi:hypothetical protein
VIERVVLLTQTDYVVDLWNARPAFSKAGFGALPE